MKCTILVLAGLTALPLAAGHRFAFRDIENRALELSENGKPVFDYNYGMIGKEGNPSSSRRSCYLHPVYAPDGTVITTDFNRNHPWHRGISWMWPVVVVDGKSYDLWSPNDAIKQRFLRWIGRDIKGNQAILAVENGWYVGDRKVAIENIEIRTLPERRGSREIFFRLKFEAAGRPIEIAGTPDDNKGYGGFCMRLAPVDGRAKATTIRTDRGILPKDGVLAVARWAEIDAAFQGNPERVRIDDDAANPGYPNGWLLRHGFPLMNVSYPGLKHLTLKPGEPLLLRYKVTLTSSAYRH